MSDYFWDDEDGEYEDEDGNPLDFADVRDALEPLIEAADEAMQTATRGLQADSNLDLWLLTMQDWIKQVVIAGAVLARGGWAQMSSADWDEVAAAIAEQYGFLGGFVNDLESGVYGWPPLSGMVFNRVTLYANAGRAAFEQTRRREQVKRGYTQERNVLGYADHCPGCLGETARGWVRLGSLLSIGARDCTTRCHCHYEFRRSVENE